MTWQGKRRKQLAERLFDWCIPNRALRRWWLTDGWNIDQLECVREVGRRFAAGGVSMAEAVRNLAANQRSLAEAFCYPERDGL